jgi:cephalosporin-C deacetylase
MKSREQVFDTLSYFDGMNFAPNIKCPVLLAVCLDDLVCPPSTGFAAYNHISGEKKIKVYPNHGHEPLPFHEEAMIEFVRGIFKDNEL